MDILAAVDRNDWWNINISQNSELFEGRCYYSSKWLMYVEEIVGMISGNELFEILCEETNWYYLQTS